MGLCPDGDKINFYSISMKNRTIELSKMIEESEKQILKDNFLKKLLEDYVKAYNGFCRMLDQDEIMYGDTFNVSINIEVDKNGGKVI
jgi:hypothetical protein